MSQELSDAELASKLRALVHGGKWLPETRDFFDTIADRLERPGVEAYGIKVAAGRIGCVRTYREDAEEELRLNRNVWGDDARVVALSVVETITPAGPIPEPQEGT